MSPTDEITPRLIDEFADAVQWLLRNGRPELTATLALGEALEDWIALMRAEHLRGAEIPRRDNEPHYVRRH